MAIFKAEWLGSRFSACISDMCNNPLGNVWVSDIGQMLFLLAILVFDPFKISSASSRMSEDIINRLCSFFYSAPILKSPGADANVVRDKFLVVLMRDADADFVNPGRGYPVPLSAHGDILKTALCQGPAAIFVDMNFRWERTPGDAEAFAQALRYRSSPTGCESQADGSRALKDVPVFVAFVPSASSLCQPLAPVLKNAADPEENCPDREALAPLRKVVVPVAMPGTDDTRRYVLQETALQAAVPGSTSPAVELFRQVCARNPKFAPGCSDRDHILQPEDTRQGRPTLAVRWGLFVESPRGQPQAGVDDFAGCPDLQRDSGRALRHLLGQFWSELWHPEKPRVQSSGDPQLGDEGWCAYHPTISSTDLIQLASRDPQRLKKIVEGRIVIYGADITAVNDVAFSPVLGALPGAQIHAMVTDNLLSLGSRYWRDAPVGLFGVRLNDWFAWGLSSLAIFLGTIASNRQSKAKSFEEKLAIGWGYLLVAFFAASLVACGLVYFWSWSPLNCLGIFAVVTFNAPKLVFVNLK